jgi:hypothetical protein
MWTYKNKTISSLEEMPDNVFGFVYEIEFTDGTKYIGKKQVTSTKTLPKLKSGKSRPNSIGIVYKNTGKGFRQCFEKIQSESDWKTYKGSHKDCKNKEPKNKTILAFAFSKLELTYLEAKALFMHEVLEHDEYINDNILGSFYRSNFTHGNFKSFKSN